MLVGVVLINLWLFIPCPQAAVAMFGYMTDLDRVESQKTEEVTAEGTASVFSYSSGSQARPLPTVLVQHISHSVHVIIQKAAEK